jgi:hypothetical protein
VGVHPVAQVVLDAERHSAGHDPPRHAERQPEHARARHGDRERPQIRAAVTDLVDRAADEVRDQDADAHGRRGEDERHHDGAPIRA